MLELFLKLIDRLIQLTTARKERHQKQFSTITEELYRDLEAIHTNYLKIAIRAKSELEENGDLKNIVRSLTQERVELEALRGKARELGKAAEASGKFDALYVFSKTVKLYFEAAGTGNSALTILKNILYDMEHNGAPDHVKRAEAIAIVDQWIKLQRESWKWVVKDYADQKVKSV